MSEDRMRILNMLGAGKISAEEAERLLDALNGTSGGESPTPGAGPKFLRVQVEKDHGAGDPKQVNIRVPLQLLRAGVRLKGVMPPKARASLNVALGKMGDDLDLDKLKPDQLETLIATLSQTAIEIDAGDGKSRLKVSC